MGVTCILASVLLLLAANGASCRTAGAVTRWRCIQEGMPSGFQNIIVRLNGSNPECASLDGIRCIRNQDSPSYCLPWLGPKIDSLALKPLQCGAAHAVAWPGNTGYNQKGHWCPVVKLILTAELQQQQQCKGTTPTGLPCSANACCKSGLCMTNSTRPLCGCKQDADCGEYSFCSAGAMCELKRYKAQACTSKRQCLSGVCRAQACTCSSDNHCNPRMYCAIIGPNGQNSECRNLKVLGDKCAQDQECFSQKCIGGACRDCSSNADCGAAGKCDLKTHTCGHSDYAQRSCKVDADCYQRFANKCVRGTCIVCLEDKHCAGSPEYKVLWSCRKALNPLDNTCLPVRRCSGDGACGIAPSADNGYIPGKCVGKTCLDCSAAGQVSTRYAGEMDLLSTGPTFMCDVSAYTWDYAGS